MTLMPKKPRTTSKSTSEMLDDRMALVVQVEKSIYSIRGHRVMLSSDLADLYGVEHRALVQAVKRNPERFPADFLFVLENQELAILRSQSVISSTGWGGARVAPMAFTELGVGMLSSVLRSERAVQANIEIMRAFIRLRTMLAEHADLKRKLTALERKYDDNFKVVFEAIRELMTPPSTPKKRRIGFIQDDK
jgi:hypothetical protein